MQPMMEWGKTYADYYDNKNASNSPRCKTNTDSDDELLMVVPPTNKKNLTKPLQLNKFRLIHNRELLGNNIKTLFLLCELQFQQNYI